MRKRARLLLLRPLFLTDRLHLLPLRAHGWCRWHQYHPERHPRTPWPVPLVRLDVAGTRKKHKHATDLLWIFA